MFGLDILQMAFNVQSCTDGSTCPGSTFNAITAAYSTLGYYWQADLLYFLTKTGLSQIAGLIYILAGFSGIMAMVLGAPPRNYVWFFIGPALYNWLVATTVPVQGVRLLSAAQESTENMQKEVWRLSAVGLHNSNYIVRLNGDVKDDEPPTPDAEVSLFFVWVDSFVSDIIESLIEITGVYTQAGSDDGNVETAPNGDRKNWSILSDLKWATLEDITAAKLRNGDIRDAFVTFLASECGDILAKQVDEGAWAAASSPGAAAIPNSVFHTDKGSYDNFIRDLRKTTIPIPDGFKNMIGAGISPSSPAVSFNDSASFFRKDLIGKDGYIDKYDNKGGISCDAYLWILVHAFRYEAAHIYFQLVGNKPGEFKKDSTSVVYNLLYGWGVGNGEAGTGNAAEKRKNYLIDLILAHLFRNEIAIAPKPVDERYAASHEIENYINAFASSVGSKTKYGEVYSWALMMPYIQGIMLYVLAAAYPFAALMVIIPGWHKTIVTWASFWLWVKIWDLGFAIVKVIERSVWAMIGNNPNMQLITEKVLEMSEWGKVNVPDNCEGGVAADAVNGIDKICVVPKITFEGSIGSIGGLDSVENTFKIFDRALTLAANLDLDLSNGYYIYIMAALYFAVPGVTGQIVLGAKAGASSLVGGMISGFSDKVAGGAQQGYQGDRVNQIQTNAGSMQQASEAKALRTSGLASQSLKEGNRGAEASLDNNASGTMASLTNGLVSANERNASSGKSRIAALRSAMDPALKGADWVGDQILGPAAKSQLQKMMSGGGAAGSAAGDTPGANSTGNPTGGKAGGKHLIGGGIAKGVAALVPIMAALADDDITQDQLSNAQAAGAANQGHAINQFKSQAESGRSGLHGQRLQGYAGFHAAGQAYRAKRDFSNQIAGSASAGAGLFAGSVAAQKPSANQDSAMSGLLNTYGSDGHLSGNAVNDANFGASSDFGNYASGGSMKAIDGGLTQRALGTKNAKTGTRENGWTQKMSPMGSGAVRDVFPGPVSFPTAVLSMLTGNRGVSVGVDTNFDKNKHVGSTNVPKSSVE